MDEKDKYRERIPIAQWPDLERKMAIIARMTSDPPLMRLKNENQKTKETISRQLKSNRAADRNIPIG